MNDRFKFRVWDKENNCMHYPSHYHNFGIVNGTIVKIESYPTSNSAYYGKRIGWEFDDALLMQCTGLKDKNGKLIYEGDILKSNRGNVRVDYDNIEACFGVSNFLTVTPFAVLLNQEWEVIGNIYNNPELLESEVKNA